MHTWTYGWAALLTSHIVKHIFLSFSRITIFVFLSAFQPTALLLYFRWGGVFGRLGAYGSKGRSWQESEADRKVYKIESSEGTYPAGPLSPSILRYHLPFFQKTSQRRGVGKHFCVIFERFFLGLFRGWNPSVLCETHVGNFGPPPPR